MLLPLKLAWRLLLWGSLAVVTGLAATVSINVWMVNRAKARTFGRVENAPTAELGIVLGTSPRTAGRPNAFFENRMDAAARLYHAGRVQRLLVSGDNHKASYDEPTAMLEALVKRGVPAEKITRDYAGFRTLDTMARARKVFGVKEALIITDDFHQPRSLFLADHFGLDAAAFSSKPVSWQWSKKTRVREMLGRVWACLDVYILRTQPRFYGPKEPLTGSQV